VGAPAGGAGPAGGAAWRLILGGGSGGLAPRSGAENMAIDQTLFESVVAGGAPVLRFYLWSPACLSLGRNQPARDIYDAGTARACGIGIVRRPTGGLAVLHDAEVTYSISAPTFLIGKPRAAYARVNAWLVAALAGLGVAAVVAPAAARGGAWRAGGGVAPCFAVPAAGEVMAGGRKLVGSAQRCEARCILQHGSILVRGDQARVRLLERQPGAAPAGGSASLEELTGRTVDVGEVVAAACAAFTTDGTRLAPARLSMLERERAACLTEHFAADSWTWRH
jgi:lipoyl(octanoyl) transferase